MSEQLVSQQPSKATMGQGVQASAARRAERERRQRHWWFRYRFHFSGLLILIPVLMTSHYFEMAALSRGDEGLGQRMIGSQHVGPWQVSLAEERVIPPRLNGEAGYMKTFNLALCQACVDQVRAVYLRVGKPRSMRTAGALGFGSAYRMGIQIPLPENTPLDADLWLTLEGWDGEIYRTTWKLANASPTTIEWLKKQQAQ